MERRGTEVCWSGLTYFTCKPLAFFCNVFIVVIMQSITSERDYVKLSFIVPFWVKFFLCFLTHTRAGEHIPTFTYTIRKKGQRLCERRTDSAEVLGDR